MNLNQITLCYLSSFCTLFWLYYTETLKQTHEYTHKIKAKRIRFKHTETTFFEDKLQNVQNILNKMCYKTLFEVHGDCLLI